MCPSVATCVSVDCCFSESLIVSTIQIQPQRVGLEQSGSHHHLIEYQLILAMI